MAKSKRRPVGIINYYGPDNTRATKLVVAIVSHVPDEEPQALYRWTVEEGDIRQDAAIAAEVEARLARHKVKQVGTAPHIMGCPHEEGIDYPLGRTCPQCPFWATHDRWTNEPLAEPVPELTVEEVLVALSEPDLTTPPYSALDSADAHRAALTPLLLEAIERCLDDPFPAREASRGVNEPQADAGERPSDAGNADVERRGGADAGIGRLVQAKYGLYLLATWRETRAYPLVLRWLSLPDDTARDMFGDDLVTEDGGRILASVCDGDLEPVTALVLNRDANAWCRAAGVRALALLGAWAEVPGEPIVDWFVWLASEGLERETSAVWQELAASSLDIEAVPVFEHLRRALEEGLVDPDYVSSVALDLVEEGEPGEQLQHTREEFPPFDDLAEAVAWWGGFTGLEDGLDTDDLEEDDVDELDSDDEWDPDVDAGPAGDLATAPADTISPPVETHRTRKVGRNEPCPCGSGKKYKKCCGA